VGEHFLNVPGARTIPTRSYKLTHEVVSDAATYGAIVAVLGNAGLGKSFSVEDAAIRTGIEYHRFVFTRRTTEKALLTKILLELGETVKHETQAELELRLTDVLSERQVLFAIDEAQDLSLRVVEYLRFFYDNVATRVGLVLVGGNGCAKNLARFPMLERRIAWRVKFGRLSPAGVLEAIPSYHAIYSDADPRLLGYVDERVAHGSLGNWAVFTLTAIKLMAGCDEPLSEAVARNAIKLIGKRR